MKYFQIRNFDVVNGKGIRTSIFVSGCALHCKNCFNSEAWDFCSGKEFTSKQFFQILELLKRPYCAGLSILGGEPFDQTDNTFLIELCKTAHALGKDVWVWSGHLFEELVKGESYQRTLLENCDILIDGRYIDELRDLSLAWRGSSNQRVLDIKKSLAEGKATWLRGEENGK